MSLKEIIYKILQKFGFGEHIRVIFFNISWLGLERIFRILVSATIGIVVLNYLGPERNGILNYATIFLALALPITNLGIVNHVVKDIIQKPEDTGAYLGTGFIIRILGFILISVILMIFLFYKNLGYDYNIIIIIIFSASFFQIANTVDWHYQALIKSKYTVINSSIAFFIASVLKLFCVFFKLDLIYIASIFSLEFLILAALLILSYKKRIGWKVAKWRFNKTIAIRYLNVSLPLILTSVFMTIYIKIDQFMIKDYLGDVANGNYSAAVKISEMFYFIPSILAMSFFPSIVAAYNRDSKEFSNKVQKVYDIFTWISIAVVIGTLLFATFFIDLIISKQYKQVDVVLKIHILAIFFIFWNAITNRIFSLQNLDKISAFNSIVGTICNISLNAYLLPKYGIIGAAYATLVSYTISGFIILAIAKNGRVQLGYIIKSFNLLRIINDYGKKRRP
jgi:O-antigen/teichoic acid export membrane protein